MERLGVAGLMASPGKSHFDKALRCGKLRAAPSTTAILALLTSDDDDPILVARPGSEGSLPLWLRFRGMTDEQNSPGTMCTGLSTDVD
jgi:hypothetical protein